MKRLVLLGLVLVSACGPSDRGLSSSSSPALPSASASQSNAGPSVGCRLPLAQAVPPPDKEHRWSVRGAFINVPTGELSIDPNGAFAESPDGRLRSVTQPYLYGTDAGATYTRRLGRWLPAKIAAVSPDSSHYAYTQTKVQGTSRQSRIHVVDVASGVDRVAYEGSDAYSVADYEVEGIYFSAATGFGDVANSGLWLLNPSSGSVRQVAPSGQPAGTLFGFYLIGAGGAWHGDVALGDKPPHSGLGPMDRLLRLDLKTREDTEWFRREGWQVQAIGFDGDGSPVVRADSGDGYTTSLVQLWLVTAPGVAKQIYPGSGTGSPVFLTGFLTAPLADAHGLWFGTSDGIFLYKPDGTFEKISTAGGEIAGRCS